METVLIIFMVLASIVGIASMVIVALTVAKELKQNKAAAANCDNCDKIANCDSCDKVPNCDECDKVVNCDECDKIPDCDNCEKIPNCDECDKVVNCDECDKIPDCDNCEKIPNCNECDKVVNCDECEYKKAAMASAESKEEVAYTQVQPAEEAEEESVEPAVVTEEAQPELSEGTVAFSATRETIDERYLALPNDYKNYYDEIVKHAASIEKSKRYKNARYEEYKVGKNSLVRMLIKRGLVVCEFVIPNFDFRNYVNDNKVAIKQAPITLKVIDESKLQIAKDTIDIAVKAIEEEKEYKKEQARQRRRERAKQVAATEE